MSVKIRLAKTGKTHQISYRIVAQDTRSPRDGKFLEILGYFNPYNKPSFNVKRDRFDHWVQKGAVPTPSVTKVIESEGKVNLSEKPKKEEIKVETEIKPEVKVDAKVDEQPKEEVKTENAEASKTDVQADQQENK
ncbi:MAG: 30S ribosomal protein S16 [Candidatus Curtissbacteria bacterium]|nr:30S ribosomal protein S16 [Candidatus Curtissbacteria bacterium]